ncbi:MAG: hypothetical protein ACPGNV_05210 [Mangrovicoccus sp.]
MDDDPNKVRLLHAREGIARIPRDQKGVPFKEYFHNTELPRDLEKAVVYATEHGPVLGTADPVPFGPEHDKKAQAFAEKLKTQIDDHGFYSGSLKRFAHSLSVETGRARDEMKALIASKFETSYGKEPYAYLQEERARKGLPVTDRGQSQDFRPDMS